MITTDLDRYEFTQASSENFKVFRSAGTDIPVKKLNILMYMLQQLAHLL